MNMEPSSISYEEALQLAYQLYLQGESLRDLSEFVESKSGQKISHEGIRKKFKAWTLKTSI